MRGGIRSTFSTLAGWERFQSRLSSARRRRGLARRPTEHHSRPPPSAHRKYVLTASFQMIPEPDVARLLNNFLEAAFWPPPQLPSCQALLKDTSAHGTAGPAAVTLVTDGRGG